MDDERKRRYGPALVSLAIFSAPAYIGAYAAMVTPTVVTMCIYENPNLNPDGSPRTTPPSTEEMDLIQIMEVLHPDYRLPGGIAISDGVKRWISAFFKPVHVIDREFRKGKVWEESRKLQPNQYLSTFPVDRDD